MLQFSMGPIKLEAIFLTSNQQRRQFSTTKTGVRELRVFAPLPPPLAERIDMVGCSGLENECKGMCVGRATNLVENIKQRSLKAKEFHNSNLNLFKPTPLRVFSNELAKELGVGKLLLKDEGKRMGLKAFKGLGVSFATQELMEKMKLQNDANDTNSTNNSTTKPTLCTMTDGNHGRAVAKCATEQGCESVIYVPHDMKQARKDAIEKEGGRVIVVDGSYDDAIEIVKSEADTNGWKLVCDTAWPGYTDVPLDIIAGYTTLFREIDEQWNDKSNENITHVILQAGVGGFAAAGVAWIELNKNESNTSWCKNIKIIIVEPDDAACLLENNEAGVVMAHDLKLCSGKTESLMSGLNCGLPSMVAYPILRDFADLYIAIGDEWVREGVRSCYKEGIVAGESGAAGIAALHAIKGTEWEIGKDSVVLCISTESDTDKKGWKEMVGLSSL